MDCRLCGLPAPSALAVEGGHAFCCVGCREVYRWFGESILSTAAAPDEPAPEGPPRGKEAYLWIDGMHCASCERVVERNAMRIPGVLAAASSYATSAARIVYDPGLVKESELPVLLGSGAYRVRLRGDDAPEYDERPELLRLFTAVCLASIVMMLSLLFVYPMHAGLAEARDYASIRWLAFGVAPTAMFALTSILVLYAGLPILRGAWTGLRVGMLNMDSLLAISVLSAYAYSVFRMARDPLDVYFDVAASIVAVVTIGRYLERGARLRATAALRDILRAWSATARVRREGEYWACPVEELRPGERVLVRQGEAIPVDGVVVGGQGAADESLISGEPFPVMRCAGEEVLGGAILVEGELEIETGRVIESRIANLARVLWNVQSSSSGITGTVDRLARAFVPAVLALAVLVGAGCLAVGAAPEQALLASLATLIVSCPCTFGLAIPLTRAAAIGAALRSGLIVTGARLFDLPSRIDIVAVDKTGTLSTGDMAVVEVIGPAETGALAAAVERASSHPIAKAIVRLDASETAAEVVIHPGRGALGLAGGRRVAVGSKALFASMGWSIPASLDARLATRRESEEVVSYVGWDGCAQGAIVTRDRARAEWEEVVARLRRRFRVVLLTGAEHPNGYEANVDEVHAGVPPEAKAAVVRRLKEEGAVAMIGDGSNDAPALAEADLGIAFGAPTALAAEAADVVIPGDRLARVFDAFELIAVTRRRIRQNLGWALSYNAIAIPLAAAGLLNPLVAALAMSASSILVVLNAARPILRAERPAQSAIAIVPLPAVFARYIAPSAVLRRASRLWPWRG